jgi:PAS domain S-box-containing protein
MLRHEAVFRRSGTVRAGEVATVVSEGSNRRITMGRASLPTRRGWLRGTGLITLVLAMVTAALGAGAFLALRQREGIRNGFTPFLQAVATFRAGELARWLAERHGDAEVASRDSMIAMAANVPASARVNSPAFVAAARRLGVITRSYGYRAVTVLDRSGAQVMTQGPPIDIDHRDLRDALTAASQSGQVQMSRLSWSADPAPGQLVLDIVAPLMLEQAVGLPVIVGTVVLRIDLIETITALLVLAPAASVSGDLALVARSGEHIVVISPKHRAEGQPWVVIQPARPTGATDALAAAVQAQLVKATGGSDSEVVAVTAAVPKVPWVVVGKAQMAEFIGPSLRALWLTCGLVAALVLGMVLLGHSLWRRRAEHVLRASEEKFRNIFENMQDGYLLADMAGEILMVNPAVVRMLGYAAADDLCGKNIERDVFETPAHRDVLKATLLGGGGVVQSHKTTFKRKDGSAIIVEGHVRMLYGSGGAPIAIEGVVRDMTGHYEVREELIRAREAALGVAKMKAQFLANMSHEIRTPLNAIVGLGHLLARSELAPEVAGYVTNIQASVRVLLDVVNNVLDFSKIEAGRMTVEMIPFQLSEVLRGTQSLLALPARDKGVDLVCALDDQVSGPLLGDPVRLGQVLTNLVGNAVKFTAAGKISVMVESVEPPGDHALIRFAVSDTGIGIAPERVATMFEPFVQADGSTTRRFGGTGLGLAISQQLVAAMGGELLCQSTPGEGSTFSFCLRFPLPATAAVLPPPVAAPVSLEGARILVVEDNAINQQVARELLEGVGATVVIADGGRAAVNMILGQGARFDAVLMDLQMPGMDGFEATREIRRHPDHRTLPIIAMTAHAFEQERGKCLAAGMNDHVAKPVEPQQLFATLLRWMATRPPSAGRIDTGAGLRRVGYNLSLYDRLLGRFAQDWRDGATRIQQFLTDGQQVEARRLAHTLKGTGATLGIEGVSAQAGAVEAELGQSPAGPLQDLMTALQTELAEACAAIDARERRHLAAATAAPGLATERAPALATIAELESLLDSRNLRAREAADRLRHTALPESCKGSLDEVVGKVARLEYAQAAVALARIKAVVIRTSEGHP